MLPSPRLAEEGVKSIIATSHRSVARHATIGLNAVPHAIELLVGISDLNACLAYVNTNDISHLYPLTSHGQTILARAQ